MTITDIAPAKAELAEMTPEEFVTLFMATIDTRTGALRYASAGHEPPLVYRAASLSWETLPSTGLPLGMEAGARYEQRTI